MSNSEIKKYIRKEYSKIVQNGGRSGCDCETTWETNKLQDNMSFAKIIGYTNKELNSIPKEANLGISCGNPTAITNLKEGETVLDLGAGAGFDVFLAASKVGATGKVIGVDMTPEMLEKAIENATKNNIENVDFRLGEIENLPVEDNSVDVVISNCVINLSTNKRKVFKEIYRVLKPGGRIAISDMALRKELPKHVKDNMDSYVGCISGAVKVEEYKRIIEETGLMDVKINTKDVGKEASLYRYTTSIIAEGRKVNENF